MPFQPGPRMGGAGNVFELLDGYPGMDQGRLKAGMTQHLLTEAEEGLIIGGK